VKGYFVSIAHLLLGNLSLTVLAIATVSLLPLGYWLIFVRPENARLGKPLRCTHYFGVFLFLTYLMLVYRRTGISTIWSIIGSVNSERALIPPDSIHLIPFASFADGFHGFLFFGLNVFMTVPLGFFLAALWPSMRSAKHIALAGFCFSLAIELSQLFTNRGTNVDDLIANTAGALIGYALFVLLHRLWIRRFSERRKARIEGRRQKLLSSKLLKNEGIIYLVTSFVGMFLLFNPAFAAQFNMDINISGMGSVIQEASNLEVLKGTVIEVSDDSIKLELIDWWEDDEGNFFSHGGGLDADTVQIAIAGTTTIDIWRIDASETVFPVASNTSPRNIKVGDRVDIHFATNYLDYLLGEEEIDLQEPAQYVIVWRFS
jgi:glycopeptide antibiotics resistance protein